MLLSTAGYAQLSIDTPSALHQCDDNFDGTAVFDLTTKNSEILNGLNPNDYSITYHITQSDANQGANYILEPAAFFEYSTVIYARVIQNTNAQNHAVANLQLVVNPRPAIPEIPTFYNYDGDGILDGQTTVDLTSLNDIATGGIPGYQVTYHVTQADALASVNPIVNASAFFTANATVYVRIEITQTSCASINSFQVVINTLPIHTPAALSVCDDNSDRFATFNLTIAEQEILGSLNPSVYSINYYETQSDAQLGVNPISDPTQYVNINPANQTVYCRVTNNTNIADFGLTTLTLIVNPVPFAGQIAFGVIDDTDGTDDGIAVVTYAMLLQAAVPQNSDYQVNFYSDSAFISPLVFPYTVNGSATFYYTVENNTNACMSSNTGTITILSADYETPAPTAPAGLTFTQGDTLADIALDGENIQWYDNDGTVIGPPTEPGDPLPLTTLLVEGTTYYATQTVYNIESNDRLPVTVNFTLGFNNTAFAGLQYYPNPVKDVFSITNTTIDNVWVINIVGQQLLTKTINAERADIDLSNLPAGIYIIRVASGGKTKSFKIVKE